MAMARRQDCKMLWLGGSGMFYSDSESDNALIRIVFEYSNLRPERRASKAPVFLSYKFYLELYMLRLFGSHVCGLHGVFQVQPNTAITLSA